ncbi:MAG: hypothetical protein AAF960_09400 [Bacteroidota bacterium]
MKSSTLKFLSIVLFGSLILNMMACEDDQTTEMPEPNETEIWTGTTITFEKVNDADPNDEANQDRLTDNVWLTRGNDGGQIYNAKSENDASKNTSPSGTQWALGTIDNVDDLDFQSFRSTITPKQAVGKDLVLFLPADNVYLSVKFTKWSSGKGGGFAYERSSK